MAISGSEQCDTSSESVEAEGLIDTCDSFYFTHCYSALRQPASVQPRMIPPKSPLIHDR
jgi:hypothetical protein